MTPRVTTHIRLDISPSDQSLRNLSSLLTNRDISRCFSAKCRGVSARTFAEKTLGEISDLFFAQAVFRGETRKKKSVVLGLICTYTTQILLSIKILKSFRGSLSVKVRR